MADQHNTNIPALTNQISADIPDIKENLEFHKDALQRIFQAWSDTDNSAAVMDGSVGLGNGSQTYILPTNNLSGNGRIMTGDTSTVAWYYASTVEGWKVQSSGGDRVLAVGYSGASYDSTDEGNMSSGGWTISMAAHNHKWHDSKSGNDESYASNGSGLAYTTTDLSNQGIQGQAAGSAEILDQDYWTANSTPSVSSWRPTAAVGRLFKLDEA